MMRARGAAHRKASVGGARPTSRATESARIHAIAVSPTTSSRLRRRLAAERDASEQADKIIGEVKDKAGVREDAVELVKTLLEKGADPNFMNDDVYTGGSWPDTTCHTPALTMARWNGDDEVEALLLEHGADDGAQVFKERT